MNWLFSILCTLYLNFNFNDGAILELSDGSQWKINEDDQKITSLWVYPIEIQVEKGSPNDASYILYSPQTNQKVKASKIN